jgi:thioesterase domain-containing protein
MIQNSAKGEDPAKAVEYSLVAFLLAAHNDFDHALQVARLIERAKPYFGQTNRFVESLLSIEEEQFKAGDRARAQETIDEALAAVEFAKSMPVGLYGEIAAQLAREGNRPASIAVVDRIYDQLAAASTDQAKQELLMFLGLAQVGIGELDAAIATAEQLPPGNQRDSIVLRVGFERAKAGDLPGALDDATALWYESWRNTSLRDVAARFSALGDSAEALATLDMIPEPAERAEGLATLAAQEAEKHDPSAPLAVELAYEAAIDAGPKTKPYVFEGIAVTHALLGDFGAAEEMIARMDDSSKIYPLWNLTEMLILGGREAEAISLAENQFAPGPKAHALLGVATALIKKQREGVR